MSAQGRDWAEAQRIRNLTLAAVLFKLGHVADPRGLVYRSQATLADLCGCDVKTIRRALQTLEEMGLIRREIRMRRDGSRSSDHIHLNMPLAADTTGSTPGLCARRVGAESPEGGGAEPPLTTFESSSESNLESSSDPDGSAPTSGAGRVDFRKDLFERGTRTVQDLTGRPTDKVRALVGSWRGLAGGDCAAVLAAIDGAVAEAVIEPVAWIEARLKRRRAEASSARAGFRPSGTLSARDALPAIVGSQGFPAGGAVPQAWNDRAMAMALRGEWPVGGSVFVAADSPEGEAWAEYYRRRGQGTKWKVLRSERSGHSELGSMMPSATPPAQMAEMAG